MQQPHTDNSAIATLARRLNIQPDAMHTLVMNTLLNAKGKHSQAEQRLDSARDQALQQAALQPLFDNLSQLEQQMRRTRRALQQQIEQHKQHQRSALIHTCQAALAHHIAQLNTQLDGCQLPPDNHFAAALACALKGKRSHQLQRTADDTLACHKRAASLRYTRLQRTLSLLPAHHRTTGTARLCAPRPTTQEASLRLSLHTYQQLQHDSHLLHALRRAGVEHWPGYRRALASLPKAPYSPTTRDTLCSY